MKIPTRVRIGLVLSLLVALAVYSNERHREEGRQWRVTRAEAPATLYFENGETVHLLGIRFHPERISDLIAYANSYVLNHLTVVERDRMTPDPLGVYLYYFRLHCPKENADSDCVLMLNVELLRRGFALPDPAASYSRKAEFEAL